MLQASRYSGGNRVPEFLRSHPLSENRIADTRNRARKYPKQMKHTNLDYQLMRARVAVQLSNTPEEAIQKFRGELEGKPISREAARYGLALALTEAGRGSEASLELDSIWSSDPDRLEYILADAEIDIARNKPAIAAQKLAKQLQLSPNNHPLTMLYAKALMDNQQAHIAEEVLIAQSKINREDPGLWYLLAEVEGLSGNIAGLHRARAEYFILNGILDEADKQLQYALQLTDKDHLTTARIYERIKDVAEMRRKMEF
jgi:predicted Zn-dependent protease